MLALALVLSLTAFYKVGTGFAIWDDVGCLMLTQKTFAAGHALYDQTFTPYGPAYYAWERLLHSATRLPLSHDATLLFTTASWVAISLLCAAYVARMTGSLLLTALTCLAVFDVLGVLKEGPGHPQELCGLLLGGMLLTSSFLPGGGRKAITLGGIGFLVGLLGMTKPNLGVFAALAGWLTLSNLLASRRSLKVLFGAGAAAALVLPLALMRHNLNAAGDYCLLEVGAVLLLLGQLATSQPDRSLSLRTFTAPVAGCAAAALLCAGYALASGTSVAGLLHGLFLQHVGFDRAFFIWPAFGVEEVLLSLGVAAAAFVVTGPGRGFWQTAPWVPTAVKISVAPLTLLAANWRAWDLTRLSSGACRWSPPPDNSLSGNQDRLGRWCRVNLPCHSLC